VRRIRGETFVVALFASVALAQDEHRGKPTTPAEQYKLLLTERKDLSKDLSTAKNADERKKVAVRRESLPLRFLELAEKNPTDPVALEALIQTISMENGTAFPAGGKGSPGQRALAVMLRDHVRSDKLGPVCQMVLFGFRRSHETFLRTVLARNPHRQVQGLACLSLAQYLADRSNRIEILANQNQLALTERYHRVFGKDYVEELQREDRAAIARETESLFARAAEQYRDVEIPVTYFGSGGTVGAKANA
jgi:hypothetical protein